MRLKFFATYRDITKCKELTIPAPPDVWALLNALGDSYGEQMRKKLFTKDGDEIGEDAIVLLNGRNIMHLDGKDTLLQESDTVSIFPMVAGG